MKHGEPRLTSRASTGSAASAAAIDLTAEDGGAGEGAPDLRTHVAARLAADLDQIAADIHRAVLEQVPAYRHLEATSGGGGDLRRSFRDIVQIFVALVRDPGLCSGDDYGMVVDAGVDVGRRRAMDGFALADVQNAAHLSLKVGLRRLRSDIMEFGVDESSFEVAGEIAEVLHDYVNAFTTAVGIGFLEVRERQADGDGTWQTELLGHVLDGRLDDEDMIAALTRDLGFEHLLPCEMVVIASGQGSGATSPTEAMSTLCEDLAPPLRSPIRSYPVPHAVALVPHDPTVSWTNHLPRARRLAERSSLVIATQRIDEIPEITTTYAWICELLAVPGGRPPSGLVHTQDLVEPWLVATTPPGSDFAFIKWSLGSVLRVDDETRIRLLRVARACVEAEGVMARAAEILGVDHRTASKHREQFESVTGFSLGHAGDRHLLHHALDLLELRHGTLPAPGAPAWGRKPPRKTP